MNWVDLTIILTLIFFALRGVGKRFIWEGIDLLSFLFAFSLAFIFYNFFAMFFETQFKVPHGLSLVIGFMVAWFLSESVFYIFLRFVSPGWVKVRMGLLEYFSFVPSCCKGLVFIALFLVMIATFPANPFLKSVIGESQLASLILKNAYGLEAPLKNVFGVIANDSLTFLTLEPQEKKSINLGFQTIEMKIDEVSENKMIDLVNKERLSRGIKALVYDSILRQIGREYSEDMLKRGYFSHYSPEGLTVAERTLKKEVDFLVVGENLAYAPNTEAAFKGFMNSQGHRANILSTDYGKIGIGVMDGGVYGKMFTQVFTN